MNSHNSLSNLALIPIVGKKTNVDTQYSMFINTYLKLGLKMCTWHQSRIHSFSRMQLLLKTERERGDDCSLSDMPKQKSPLDGEVRERHVSDESRDLS